MDEKARHRNRSTMSWQSNPPRVVPSGTHKHVHAVHVLRALRRHRRVRVRAARHRRRRRVRVRAVSARALDVRHEPRLRHGSVVGGRRGHAQDKKQQQPHARKLRRSFGGWRHHGRVRHDYSETRLAHGRFPVPVVFKTRRRFWFKRPTRGFVLGDLPSLNHVSPFRVSAGKRGRARGDGKRNGFGKHSRSARGVRVRRGV
mmetsp:Transcript_4778/g.15951  ORF Transcript_4778/g.15951 Transcript_4778/m.15951 type:complete len:201 (-) Transcript_4778:791-1393(-)